MWRDAHFWAALIAAPLYWGALFLLQEPRVDLYWPLLAPWAFLLVALVYPFLEEVIFRGLIQEYVQRRMPRKMPGPVSAANLISSVLFAALHVALNATLWRAGIFFPSLVFGYFKDRYGKLTAPIVLHVFYNSGYFLLFHTNS